MPLRTPLTWRSSETQPSDSKAPHISPPPATPVEPVVEFLHGIEITDPYRWLEDQNSARTREWIKKQTAYTRAYFEALPGRELIKSRVAELLPTRSVSDPWQIGNHYFFLKRHNNSEQPAITMREGLFGRDAILVDPALRGKDSSTAISIITVSHDGHYLAYSVRQGGTDHSALEILDVERRSVLPDRLPEGFCSGIIFALDGSGFYYSHRHRADPRPNYKAVLWHAFGTEQGEDQQVFFAGESPDLSISIQCSFEAKILAYTVFSTGKHRRTSLYLHPLLSGSRPTLVVQDIPGSFVPFFMHERLMAYTDLAAPNCRIVQIDLSDPRPSAWKDIVPESKKRIQQFAVAGGKIVITRVDGFGTCLEAFSFEETRERSALPFPYGTISLLNRTNGSDKLFFSYTSIRRPSSVYCYDTEHGDLVLWENAEASFDGPEIAIDEVFYTSKDGTPVPLLLVARKDLLHSGPLPTFLTGYGGFGSCVTPRFTAFTTFLIEQGLLFAVPALRGGSECGEEWHSAAIKAKRQNSFDDFIAAAEWLVQRGYSATKRIAIGGGSNAGLLVGAAITQRPDLFRAAICLGPLLDMTRYHRFDFAARWTNEYGSPEDEEDFKALLAYSPYHRVRNGAAYPAVMLISGDADTRCNPMHARKMTARLQQANSSGHPILLDYKPTWGHTPVQPMSAKINALADRLAFICQELGVLIRLRRTSQ